MKEPWVLSYPLITQRRLIRLGGCPGCLIQVFAWRTGHFVCFVMWWLMYMIYRTQAFIFYFLQNSSFSDSFNNNKNTSKSFQMGQRKVNGKVMQTKVLIFHPSGSSGHQNCCRETTSMVGPSIIFFCLLYPYLPTFNTPTPQLSSENHDFPIMQQ